MSFVFGKYVQVCTEERTSIQGEGLCHILSIKCYERKDSPVSGMSEVPDDNEESDKNLLSMSSDVSPTSHLKHSKPYSLMFDMDENNIDI